MLGPLSYCVQVFVVGVDSESDLINCASTVIYGGRTIGMEDNWHALNWHGGQLALTVFNYFLVNYFNVLTNNKFHFQKES